jgi:hypothetical protein
LIRVSTAPPGKTVGDAVDAGVSPQLVKDNAKAWFVGGSYAFK